MDTEYILWGTPKNSPAWDEKIITETKDVNHLKNAIKWAQDNEFINIRILTYNGELPDFLATINPIP